MSLEWLIDDIKEWVLSLAYATEAWVLGKDYQSGADIPEWTTPLSVTGTLNPDAVSTYLKTGTYNDKPYYRRLDGAYFIWWNGINYWFISKSLGLAEQPLWGRLSPDLLGFYSPVPPTVGLAKVVEGYQYLKTGFVDRGDPAAYDFTVGDFNTDHAWHDLDLSAIVPAGAKGVLLSVYIYAPYAYDTIEFRKNGNVNEAADDWMMNMIVGLGNSEEITCACDENRLIEYRCSSGEWTIINVTVKAWWF